VVPVASLWRSARAPTLRQMLPSTMNSALHRTTPLPSRWLPHGFDQSGFRQSAILGDQLGAHRERGADDQAIA
jgi:hypothetical protein